MGDLFSYLNNVLIKMTKLPDNAEGEEIPLLPAGRALFENDGKDEKNY